MLSTRLVLHTPRLLRHLCHARPSTPIFVPGILPAAACLRLPSARMASTLPRLPIFSAIHSHMPDSVAVVHSDDGASFTYGDLVRDVAKSKSSILKASGKDTIRGERVAFLVENTYDYVGM